MEYRYSVDEYEAISMTVIFIIIVSAMLYGSWLVFRYSQIKPTPEQFVGRVGYLTAGCLCIVVGGFIACSMLGRMAGKVFSHVVILDETIAISSPLGRPVKFQLQDIESVTILRQKSRSTRPFGVEYEINRIQIITDDDRVFLSMSVRYMHSKDRMQVFTEELKGRMDLLQ